MATITGANFIGRTRVEGGEPFRATDPSAGQPIEPAFSSASAADVDRACALAREAFPAFRALDRAARADLLDAIGDAIMALGDDLLDRAHKESGLPLARLTGERGRTVGQLKLFATVLRDGGYLDLRIEHADAERQPLPKPDLRLRKIPVGPVAVFGASNFPLAFSVAGGDTASALAAGCPVVVKGHPAHPGTSELIASAIVSAVEAAGLPEGVFSLLNGTSNALGEALVSDPRIKAVGFTGSRGGGLALMKIAASRPEPIPVYAEMSAINPVVLFPGALDARAEALGKAYVGSLTMGAGQFCTNPGLVLAVEGDGLDRFVAAAAEALTGAPAATMLTPGIHKAYESGVEKLGANAHVETVARGQAASGPTQGQAAIFATDAATLVHDKEIGEEVFGASSLLVRCKDAAELAHALSEIEGQLTATVHFEPADVDAVREVLPVLEDRVGRILANGWPTGVEVSPAMVHGGPFPATSDGRTTSVGTLAIDRFVRPVSYQDIPEALLPTDLRGDGAAGVPRRVDGKVRID